ncbi:hypothetical protein D3C76_1633170 [compost metagenome]
MTDMTNDNTDILVDRTLSSQIQLLANVLLGVLIIQENVITYRWHIFGYGQFPHHGAKVRTAVYKEEAPLLAYIEHNGHDAFIGSDFGTHMIVHANGVGHIINCFLHT